MSTKPTIRAANLADLDDLIALDNVVRSTPARHAFIRRSVAQGACLIAVLEDELIGYVILDHTLYENGFISFVYVAEGHRRSGIGTALVQPAERTCRTPKLFTSTNASNVAMRDLLLGQGYKPSGMVENLDVGDPELLLFKRIPDRAIVE
jgi:ribosomal protein S18 acetylase RimI-like enzyme